MVIEHMKIYQGPMQGFTDLCQRKAFSKVYGGVDKYFIPYISYGKNHEIKKSQLKDILPENNINIKVVPQVLFANTDELIGLVNILLDMGHSEINLNLGCPYPMVTNRGRGAAWLLKPDELQKSFDKLFEKQMHVSFSVKLRSGMSNQQDSDNIFKVLNKFTFEEIIFHPRTADQLYAGKANLEVYKSALSKCSHNLVYNGDILSESDFLEKQTFFNLQRLWMIGRGLLIDPALALKLKGSTFDRSQIRTMMSDYHENLLSEYSERLQGSSHLLMKMKNFWTYFSESFDNPHKAMKLIKKSGSIAKYNAAVSDVFRNF